MAENLLYENSILSLHLGADGGGTFVDKSKTPKTLTVSGPTITSSTSPFAGQSSAVFNGTSDYVYAATGEAIGGLNTFTMELFFNSANVSGVRPLITKSDGSNVRFFLRAVNGTSLEFLYYGPFGNATASGAVSFSAGAWHHVALVANLQTLTIKIYFDGIQAGNLDIAAHWVGFSDAAFPLAIGRDVYNSTYFNGNIAELHVYPGVAKYTGNFTPMTDALFDSPSILYSSRQVATAQGVLASTLSTLAALNR